MWSDNMDNSYYPRPFYVDIYNILDDRCSRQDYIPPRQRGYRWLFGGENYGKWVYGKDKMIWIFISILLIVFILFMWGIMISIHKKEKEILRLLEHYNIKLEKKDETKTDD